MLSASLTKTFPSLLPHLGVEVHEVGDDLHVAVHGGLLADDLLDHVPDAGREDQKGNPLFVQLAEKPLAPVSGK